jgi:hypothetical protein
VNRVAGDLLEYVQQNICSPEGQPVVTDTARIEVQLQGDRQLFTEGEFVWQEVILPFLNPEELNILAIRSELFESFELKRQPGVVRD